MRELVRPATQSCLVCIPSYSVVPKIHPWYMLASIMRGATKNRRETSSNQVEVATHTNTQTHTQCDTKRAQKKGRSLHADILENDPTCLNFWSPLQISGKPSCQKASLGRGQAEVLPSVICSREMRWERSIHARLTLPDMRMSMCLLLNPFFYFASWSVWIWESYPNKTMIIYTILMHSPTYTTLLLHTWHPSRPWSPSPSMYLY